MSVSPFKIVFLGLSITSTWENSHATVYRGLLRELSARGHDVMFLERNTPWFAARRDLPQPAPGRVALYNDLADLKARFSAEIRAADLVVIGSSVPEGVEIGYWITATVQGVTAFYDLDMPATLERFERGNTAYLSRPLVARYDLYMASTGGPLLERLERFYDVRRARPLYRAVDPADYYPEPTTRHWEMGYLGTYSDHRQPLLDSFLVGPAICMPATRFVVAGPQYPLTIKWPANVEHIYELPVADQRAFYNAQRWSLQLADITTMQTGYCLSEQLLAAAACATPLISDYWPGLEHFFTPGSEILIAETPGNVLHFLQTLTTAEREELGRRARARVLAEHTVARRAAELEGYLLEVLARPGERELARAVG